jgi:hypothetical protein
MRVFLSFTTKDRIGRLCWSDRCDFRLTGDASVVGIDGQHLNLAVTILLYPGKSPGWDCQKLSVFMSFQHVWGAKLRCSFRIHPDDYLSEF